MRWLTALLLLAGGIVAALALAWPLSVACIEAAGAADWSRAALTGRHAILLGRGVEIAAESAVLSVLLGAALAAGIGCAPRRLAAALSFAGLATILSPPYVHAYAWSLILLRSGVATSQDFAGDWHQWLALHGRAVWCLGTWTAPLAAAVLLCGWRSAGKSALALAAQDARADQALLRVLPRALAPWAALAALIAAIVALTEYSVCHLCLVVTYNTQVLADVQLLAAPGQALLLAWPLAALILVALAGLWPLRRMIHTFLVDAAGLDDRDIGSAILSRTARTVGRAAGLLATACLLAPLVILLSSAGGVSPFVETWQRYGDNWPLSIAAALTTAAAAGVLALTVDYLFLLARGSRAAPAAAGVQTGFSRLFRRVPRIAAVGIILLAALGAVLPPALVGDAAAAAWARVPLIRDHWPVLALVSVARYGIFAIGAMWLTSQAANAAGAELAAVDGASPAAILWRVRAPRAARLLGAVLGAVALLSLLEVAATTLVQPPGVASIAQTMLNAIHFGRDAQVAAMCMYLVAAAALGAGVMRLILRR